MEAEELFRKLRPVLGKRLEPLWREYQLDRAARPEIEELLHVLALRHLGMSSGPGRILLPPPRRARATGPYQLGRIIYAGKEVATFGLREDEWIQHVAVLGRSGSGKTNVGLLILRELLARGKPVLVFDWKRNYRDAASQLGLQVFTVGRNVRPFSFNPLEPPPGIEPSVWLRKVADVMAHVYGVRQAATYVLQRAFEEASAERRATIEAVRDHLAQMPRGGREGQWLQSARRAVDSLCHGPMASVLGGAPISIPELLERAVVLELDALADEDKAFLIDTLFLWLHQYRLQQGSREEFKHAVLIEEAHHVLLRRQQSRETVMDVVLREIRELGEAVIFIDQHPSLISIPSLGNTYCTIVMNLKHGNDVAAIGGALRLDAQTREYLGRLPVGSGIVRLQGRWPYPFLVRFPEYEVRKGSVTDEMVAADRADSAPRGQIRPPESATAEIRRVRHGDEETPKQERHPNAELLKLLEDACSSPLAGVADRYRRLKLSADRGTRLKDELVARAWARTTRIQLVDRAFVALVPTRAGLAVLHNPPTWPESDDHAGAEHEFWKGWLFGELRKRGLAVHAERTLPNGHRVDLLVAISERSLAIEVETGKSDIAGNVAAIRAGDATPVVLVATSKEALSRIEATLATSTAPGGVRFLLGAEVIARPDVLDRALTLPN